MLPPSYIVLRACYAVSGTEIGYAATRLYGTKGTPPLGSYGKCPQVLKTPLWPTPRHDIHA
eukprot:1000648-Rhodomonas_salina.1